MCIADSLFMRLHSGRHIHQVSRIEAAPLTGAAVIDHHVGRILSVGLFALGLGRIFPESFVPGPTIAGAKDALAGIEILHALRSSRSP